MDLDDVSDRDHADELLVAQDGNLRDMPLAHLAHHVVDVVFERARDGAGGHHLGDPQPAEPFTPVVNQAQDVALAEDADQPSVWSTTGSDPMLF